MTTILRNSTYALLYIITEPPLVKSHDNPILFSELQRDYRTKSVGCVCHGSPQDVEPSENNPQYQTAVMPWRRGVANVGVVLKNQPNNI